jgi:hypothetical protein
MLNLVLHYSTNLILPGDDVASWTTQDIDERIEGSKIAFWFEMVHQADSWLTKACILILYHRITYVSKTARGKTDVIVGLDFPGRI